MKSIRQSGCLLLLLLVPSTHSDSRGMPPQDLPSLAWADLAPNVLDGDVVFRRGRSLNSRAVMLADQAARFSHVGIVVHRGEEPQVVHSVPPVDGETPGGARMEPLELFLSREMASDWAVFRLQGEERAEQRVAAAAVAVHMAESAAAFDDEFDLADDTKLYCTELVWRAFDEAGVDLTQGNFDTLHLPMFSGENLILPSRLEKSPYLWQVLELRK